MYNVVFTVLPPLVIGVFDQLVSARILDRYPHLYMLGQKNAFFTPAAFWLWVGNALYHSVVGPFPLYVHWFTRLTFVGCDLGPIRILGDPLLGGSQTILRLRLWPLVLGYLAVSSSPTYRPGESRADF